VPGRQCRCGLLPASGLARSSENRPHNLARAADFERIPADEFALADKPTPPISIVAQDPDLIGTTAATRLFARINGDITPPRELILRTRFISRSEEISPR
jgi:DNA-binding LacI/PurR family transcriptional regulator